MNYLWILYIFLISFGVNLVFFVLASIFKTDVFTDITYALTFALNATIVLIIFNKPSILQILMYVLLMLWAFRLGSYLFIRILKLKIDHRFDKMRNSVLRFGIFWLIQSITVWLVGIPIDFALTIPASYFENNNLSYIALIFLGLAIFGLIYETIADLQKNAMHKKKLKQKIFAYGLYKVSRHPNYFGELTFWWNFTLFFCISFLINNVNDTTSYWYLFWLLSPFELNLLLLFLSGVNLIQKNNYERYKDNTLYLDYVKKVSVLIPLFGKKGWTNNVKKIINTNK